MKPLINLSFYVDRPMVVFTKILVLLGNEMKGWVNKFAALKNIQLSQKIKFEIKIIEKNYPLCCMIGMFEKITQFNYAQ
jgi:hypothetical protein